MKSRITPKAMSLTKSFGIQRQKTMLSKHHEGGGDDIKSALKTSLQIQNKLGKGLGGPGNSNANNGKKYSVLY